MTTSTPKQRVFRPTQALARAVEWNDDMIHIVLTDGRVVSVPLAWFPSLLRATSAQRAQCEIGAGGRGLHWEELDEDLSVAGLMAGADLQSA